MAHIINKIVTDSGSKQEYRSSVKGGPALKKFQQSDKKVMATIVWKKFCLLIRNKKKIFQESRKLVLLLDNASFHCGFEEIYHPPYNIDLAPSDLFISKLQKNRIPRII